MGSPGASTYSPSAPHPYMQKTRTIEFSIVQEGEIVLVLDTQEIKLNKGDFVIWDNLATMHRATAFDDSKHHRELRRVTTIDVPLSVTA